MKDKQHGQERSPTSNSPQQPQQLGSGSTPCSVPAATATVVGASMPAAGDNLGAAGQAFAIPIQQQSTTPFNGTINVVVNSPSNRIDGEMVVPRTLQQLPTMKHGGSLADRRDWLKKVFTTLSVNDSGIRWFVAGDVRLVSCPSDIDWDRANAQQRVLTSFKDGRPRAAVPHSTGVLPTVPRMERS